MTGCLVCSRDHDDTFRRASLMHPAQFCDSCASELEKLDEPVRTFVVGALVTAANAPREGMDL